MSYGLRYYGEVADYYDAIYKVEIEEEGFDGTAEEMAMAADNPLALSYPGDEFDVFRPIFGSQLSITVISEIDFQYVALHTADARKYKVTLYKDEEVFWVGWILPDLFTEPYVSAPYPVTLTARCGLGELDSVAVPPEVMSYGDGETPTEKSYVNLYSVVSAALNHINTGLSIHEAINIYNAERGTEPVDTDTTLTDIYIDLGQYQDESYYTLLSDALRVFGARLYQQDGAWWMVRVIEYTDEIRYRILTTTGGSISFDTKTTNTYYIGKDYSGARIVNNGPELRINPAWKQFDIITRRDLREGGLLENPDFSEVKIVEVPIVAPGPVYYDLQVPYPVDWQVSPDPSIDPAPNFPYFYLLATGGFAIGLNSGGDWIRRTYQTQVLESSFEQGLKLIIDAYVDFGAASTSSFAIRIEATGTPDTYYARIPDTEGDLLTWTTTPTNIVMTGVPINPPYVATSQRYEFITNSLPVTGTYEISIFGAQNARLVVLNASATLVRVQYISEDPTFPTITEYPAEESQTVIINPNNSYIPSPIEVSGGDLPDIPNAELIYQFGYRDLLRARTRVWTNYDEIAQLPLLTHLANQYTSMYLTPQWVLQIPILSNGIKFDSSVVDPAINAKKYLCVSADWNLKSGVFSGIFAETDVAAVGTDWLLATGEWNDLGIWDDSEEWID